MIKDEPLYTETHERLADFIPEADTVYVGGVSVEERSTHSKEWEARAKDVQFVKVLAENESDISVDVGGAEARVALRSSEQLRRLVTSRNGKALYLDITGLSHHVWAPLLQAALAAWSDVRAVYVEPGDYRFSPTPTEGEIFDLSEEIKGVRPLPGFASLGDPDAESVCFVPLLGFEGTRLAYMVEQVQPPGGKIVPVVGVPGFRPEYPFYAFHGNRAVLIETKAWRNVRYAIANCPFSIFYLVTRIRADFPGDALKIAPIGTKPHALGAVLFSIANPGVVEIVYDHPIRKAARTAGASRLLVYRLSAFSTARP